MGRDRLERRVRTGVVEVFSPLPTTARSSYRLTPKGRSLLSVLEELYDWGLAHIKGTGTRMKPVI